MMVVNKGLFVSVVVVARCPCILSQGGLTGKILYTGSKFYKSGEGGQKRKFVTDVTVDRYQ